MSLLTLLELFAPNPVLNNLLFNEYGMGVTFLCLYAILAGLSLKKFRIDSILFLLFGVFGVFSWLLNGTLYARPKILIPVPALCHPALCQIPEGMPLSRLCRKPARFRSILLQ